jgi:alpha-galactosidase
VGDTVGPGGINRSLRNVPVLVGIGKAMEEHCPDAWLLNITNPMTCLTRAVCRETEIKTVGLCHEVGNFCMDLAIALGRPFESVSCAVTGVNHFPVLTSLEVDGADGFDLLRKLVDELGGLDTLTPFEGRTEAEPFSKLDFARRHVFKLMLLDRWGTFPAAGDRHIAEFVPFALTPESNWGAAYNIGLSPISRREQHQAEYVADVDAWLAGTKDLQTWQSGELPSPIIQAMLSGEPFEAPVNIPNTGQGVGLPADAVLESICVIGDDGIRSRDQTALPAPYDEIVRRHVATQELTVEAALRGDRVLAGEAFALDPLAGRGDFRVTEAMVDALLAGTAEWLPRFA